ncbi:MAG: FAD binding domain-containing protein [Bacteroidales bacterium]|nr:FAD binding domain-containing protein [Bacteroidales bacterium]
MLKEKNHPSALLSTGATDLALRQSKKFELLPEILDLSGLQELDFCREEADCWIISAGTPINDI